MEAAAASRSRYGSHPLGQGAHRAPVQRPRRGRWVGAVARACRDFAADRVRGPGREGHHDIPCLAGLGDGVPTSEEAHAGEKGEHCRSPGLVPGCQEAGGAARGRW